MLLDSLARRALFGLALVLFVGCDPNDDSADEEEEEGPSASGQWVGGVTGLTFELILVELDGGQLSGTGTARSGAGSLNLAVESGTHRHPDIGMTLSVAGLETLVLTGKFESDDEIRGKANGSGLSEQPFTLVRD